MNVPAGQPTRRREGLAVRLLVAQTIVLLTGTLTALLIAARRIAHRRYFTPARRRSTLVPFTVLIVVLGALNAAMFLYPMTHRM